MRMYVEWERQLTACRRRICKSNNRDYDMIV